MKPRLLPVVTVASLVGNAILVTLLLTSSPSPGAGKATETTLCSQGRVDLDFFIEGLDRGQEALYTPLAVRSLAPLLVACHPDKADEIEAIVMQLRVQLLKLVAENTPQADRAAAQKEARKLFVDLRDQSQ